MLSGDNGILQQTTNAKTKTVHANVLEQMQLEANAYTIDKTTASTSLTLIDFLKGKSIITTIDGEDGKWKIDVEKLLGSKQTMGNETATKDKKEDVYLLEEQPTSTGNTKNVKVATTTPIKIATATSNSKIYKVVYYGIDTNNTLIVGDLNDTNSKSEVTYSYHLTATKINSTRYEIKLYDDKDNNIPIVSDYNPTVSEGTIVSPHIPFIDEDGIYVVPAINNGYGGDCTVDVQINGQKTSITFYIDRIVPVY